MSTRSITSIARIGIIALASTLLPGSLIGCASNTSKSQGEMPEGVKHRSSSADLAALESTQALEVQNVVLWVNGLGCPQCASNVDAQLTRLPGVVRVSTDLSRGKVRVDLSGARRPSPRQFKDAIEDAGFTLVKVESAKS
jgi:copper chaperone CopZ